MLGCALLVAGTALAYPQVAAAQYDPPSVTLTSGPCVDPNSNATVHLYADTPDGTTLSFADVDTGSDTYHIDLGGARFAERDVIVSATAEVYATATDSAGDMSYEAQADIASADGCPANVTPTGVQPLQPTAAIQPLTSVARAGVPLTVTAAAYNTDSDTVEGGTMAWQTRTMGSSGTWSDWLDEGTSPVAGGPFTATSPAFTFISRSQVRAQYTPPAFCGCATSDWSPATTVPVAPNITISKPVLTEAATYVRITAHPNPGSAAQFHFQVLRNGSWHTVTSSPLLHSLRDGGGYVTIVAQRPVRGGVYRVTSDETPVYSAGVSARFVLASRGYPSGVIADCRHYRFEPASVQTCGDGTVNFTKIRYRTYTDRRATGTLVAAENNCMPDCARGTIHKRTSQFVFFRVRHVNGRPVFTRAQISRHGKALYQIALG